MNQNTIGYLIAIFTSGAISSLIVYIFSILKKESVIKQHGKDICFLKDNVNQTNEVITGLKDNLSDVRYNTNERLVIIETKIVGLDVKLTDMAKDLKLVLMQGQYKDT